MSEFDHPHRQLVRSIPRDILYDTPWQSARRDRPEPEQKVLVWDGYNRIFWLGEYCEDSGYFTGEVLEMQTVPPSVENPGRIHGAHSWYPVPEHLQHLTP